MGLLVNTPSGLYCPKADVYLDPWKPVPRAILSHGHADHARWGSANYLCTPSASPVIRHRLGDISLQTLEYGKEIDLNGVTLSFHPAGHVLGSAQIRVSYRGEVAVFSGDYKVVADGFCEPFEAVRCHTFITESTFGLPVYHWTPQEEVFLEIAAWQTANRREGRLSVLYAYSLGKAQRLLQGLPACSGPFYTHTQVETVLEVMRNQGITLRPTIPIRESTPRADLLKGIIIAPPAAQGANWMHRFEPMGHGMVSGWMSLRGMRRRRNADKGFVLSDHADWKGLNEAIGQTGADKILVTHGYAEILSAWLREKGLDAAPLETDFEGDETL